MAMQQQTPAVSMSTYTGAVKITTKREENLAKQQYQQGMNPGTYLSESDKAYRQKMNPVGSFATEMIRNRQGQFGSLPAGSEAEAAATQAHRYSSRPNRYLSTLQFGWVKDKFLTLRGNKSTSMRLNFLMYAVPITLGAAFGGIHYLQQSFAIYLKHQALIDAYYIKTLNEQSAEAQPVEKLADQESEVNQIDIPEKEAKV